MEGKNCFRNLWRQTPLYSGGNFSTLLVPSRKSLKMACLAFPPLAHLSSCSVEHSNEECLVLPCGNSVYVVSSSTGEVFTSFSLPIEDVILCVDAVTVFPYSPSFTPLETEVDTTTSAPHLKRVKLESESSSNSAPSRSHNEGKMKDEQEHAPPGAYIAIGTRNRQIYVIRVEEGLPDPFPEQIEEPIMSKDRNEEETDKKLAKEAQSEVMKESGVETAKGKSSTESLRNTVEYICTVVKQWTAAQQAISCLEFSSQGRCLVSGSTDGGVKVWNIFHHHLTHNLHCPGSSLIHTVYVTDDDRYLITGSFEGHVSVFDLQSKQLIATSRPHVQAVEALSFRLPDGLVYSIGRDRKMCTQQLSFPASTLKTPKISTSHYSVADALTEKRAIVVKEDLSCATFEGQYLLHTGSHDGVVTTYIIGSDSGLKKHAIARQPPVSPSGEDRTEEDNIRCIRPQRMVKGMDRSGLWRHDVQGGPSILLVADSGCRISLLVAASSSTPKKSLEEERGLHYTISHTLVGFCDQVLEIHLLPSSLAPLNRLVVTNSRDARLFGGRGCLSSHCLRGHTDIVMSAAVSQDGRLIATAGKDLEIRFWCTKTWDTVAVGEGGHTADITSLRFNAKQLEKDGVLLLFSSSADENLRLWDAGHSVLPLLTQNQSGDDCSVNGSKGIRAPSRFSSRDGVNSAHAGPIYTLEVAPNDQYVATGGKDKVVNLWAVRGKKVYKEGVLKGHRRGITSLCFSTVERVLASASNDGTVRLWSLVSLTCVKSLQADRVAVLQVALFNKGTQAVTTNAEGVLRVWALGAGEVVWSGEVHEDKVWALAVHEEEDKMKVERTTEPSSRSSSCYAESIHGQDTKTTNGSSLRLPQKTLFLTGGADGMIVATEDCTEEEVERIVEERKNIILKEQELANTIRKGNFKDAFLLALHLDHPRHLRQVVERWIAKNSEDCDNVLRKEISPSLSPFLTARLLQFVREWLANSRYCTVGSAILRAFMSSQHFQDLAEIPSMRQIIEPLLAYSKKHSHRLHELLYKSYYIDYVTRNLAPHALTTQPLYATVAPLREDGHVETKP